MLRVLRNARIPIFLHRKSNHIFTVWQHMVLLLVIRQYEGKSYRLFSEWLVEAYYLRMFLQLSHIPHFTTLQKFTERVNDTMRLFLFLRKPSHIQLVLYIYQDTQSSVVSPPK